tara:strand:- start:228 stop:803 length:576 start_codon:yes stop_codon:yes gene_type:complete
MGVKVLKEIVEWPSLKLSKKALPVFKIDENIKQLSIDLIDTCNVMFGIGLAASQIGVLKRMIVIKPKGFNAENLDPSEYNKEYTVMINPQIETSGEKIEWTESCLSLPGTQGKVTRSQQATVTYLNLDGETKTLVADWPYAGGLQHEIDHLEGILYTKRQEGKRSFSTLSRLKRVRRKEMIKQRKLRRERE